jgi:autotransporter-associated beta strand protein
MKILNITEICNPLRVALKHSALAVAVGAWLAGGTALAAPPVNDDFANAIVLPGVTGTQTGTNTAEATSQVGEPVAQLFQTLPVNTVWFKWTCPEDGQFTVRTDGSTDTAPTPGEWDAILGIYSGAALNALTPLGATPKDTVLQETMTVPVIAGNTYHIQLAGFDNGLAANILLNWSFVRTIYEANILTFGPGATIGEVVDNAATIEWTYLYGSNRATLAPTFTLSPGATCTPTSGAIPSPNFSTSPAVPVTYTVTAAGLNPTVNVYTVTATEEPVSIACDITSFGANVAGSYALFVSTGETTGTILWTVPAGTTVASLAPSYTISPGATCSQPNPGVPSPAFSTAIPVPYLVTAQNAITAKTYTVIVRVATPPPVAGGLRLWLDASQLTGLADGQQVETWTDKSGLTGNDALRTAGSPKYKTNVLSGKPVIRFDNASSFTTADLSSQFPTAATVFVMTTINSDSAYTLVNTKAGADEWWRYDGNGRSYSALFRSSRVESYCDMPSSGTHLFSVSSAATAWQMWIDGSNKGVAAGAYGAGGVHVIGNNSNNRFLNGDIAEVIEYDRVLNEEERLSVEAYLTDKWMLVADAAKIFAFGPGAVIGPVVDNAAEITWTVPFGTDVTMLPATFTMSSGASCDKVSGATQNFTLPQVYTVTSLDTLVTNVYTVSVNVTPISSACDITSFGPGAVISGTNIVWYVPFGSDVAALMPTYTMSPFATGAPTSGATVDFTNNPQTFTITAQDLTSQEYSVTATVAPDESTVLWNPSSGGNWDLSTVNWLGQSSGLPTPFFNGDHVIFGKTTGGTIAIAPGMSPLSTTVSATSGTYTFSGGPIATGSLTKSGGGSLVLKSPNTYAGDTLIAGGTVNIDNLVQGTLGTGTVTMDAGGTLTLSRQVITNAVIIGPGGGKINGGNSFNDTLSGPVTLNGLLTIDAQGGGSHEINGNISGSGGITKISTPWHNGSGMVLRGTNTYTGPTSILGGKAQVTKADALGGGDLIIGNIGGNVNETRLNLNYSGTKIVASLTLNGVVRDIPGTYGSVASGATFQDDTLFVGAGTVTVLPAAKILAFGTNVVGSSTVISPVVANAATIAYTVPSGTVLAEVAPEFTMSFGATCTQTSGAIPSPNFSTGPVAYSVTSSDSLITNVYTVTVTVRPPFIPPPLPPVTSGMAVWLAGDSVNIEDFAQIRLAGSDTFVKQWNDLSGNGNNAANATESQQPKYIAGALNGKPVLRFAEANSSQLLLGDLSAQFWATLTDPYPNAVNRGSEGVAIDGTYINFPTRGVMGALVGDSNTATTLNGGNQNVRIPWSAALNPATAGLSDPFTVEAWVKSNGAPTGNHVIIQSMRQPGQLGTVNDVANDRSGWFLRQIGTDLQFAVGTATGAPFYYYYTVTGVVSPTNWQHVVVVYDGDETPVIYIDKVAQTYVVTRQDGLPFNEGEEAAIRVRQNTDCPEIIGDRAFGGWGFNGVIDEVAIYSSALSQPRIQAHYENGINNPARSQSYDLELAVDSPVAHYKLDEPAAPVKAATVFAVTTLNNDSMYSAFGNRANDERWVGGNWSEVTPGAFRGARANFPGTYAQMPSTGSHIFAYESSTTAYRFLLNGAQIGSTAGDYNAGAGVSWVVGSNAAANGAQLNGDIAELILFNRVLTTEEANQVGAYLENKYGLNTAYVASGYGTWATANAGGQSANQDYNNDGVQNGIAYFMGATGTATNPGLDAANKVTWPMSATFSGTYEVQTSPNLGTWTNVIPRPLPAGGNLTYTLPPGLGTQFVRLLVTPTP